MQALVIGLDKKGINVSSSTSIRYVYTCVCIQYMYIAHVYIVYVRSFNSVITCVLCVTCVMHYMCDVLIMWCVSCVSCVMRIMCDVFHVFYMWWCSPNDSGYTAEFAAQLSTTTFESSLQSIKTTTTEKEVHVLVLATNTYMYVQHTCM